MTGAEVLDRFRRMYERGAYEPEQHLAQCPQLEVLRFEVAGEGAFDALLKCPHSRPLGYSVGPIVPPAAVIERRHRRLLRSWQVGQ